MEKSTINTRIEFLRKELRLNQAAFGERIGLGGGAIGKMERGGTVTDQNIKLICEKFRIRREWLVDGEGEMFISGEPGIFAEFAKEYNLTSQEQEVAKYLLSLSEGERANIMHYLQNIAAAMERGRHATDTDVARRNEAHRLLDQELAAQEKEPSVSTTGSSATTADKIDA